MAQHSVPQDVEADDKLIGFLSLKQFIFTIVGLAFGYLTFFFFTRVHPISALIWLPFMLVFLVLGLYQRKDQPAEVFLLSAIGFYLKPHTRIWSQDGYEERVHITAPPVVEKRYTKDFTGDEAIGRLAGLSRMMDSRGWASKQVADWQNPQLAAVAAGTDSDRIISAQTMTPPVQINQPLDLQPPDQYDATNSTNQQWSGKINAADNTTRMQAIQHMQQAQPDPSIGAQDAPALAPVNPPVLADAASTNQLAAQPLASGLTQAEPVGNGDTTDEASTEKVSDMPSSNELNIPHQTEDGSIELRLH